MKMDDYTSNHCLVYTGREQAGLEDTFSDSVHVALHVMGKK